MEAVILAGGFGTRLQDEVPDCPKPMAPIAGKPFLSYLLYDLSVKGFTRVIISVGYLSEQIVNTFGNNAFGMEIVYVHEDTPLGTGGGVRKALQYCNEDYAFVLNGDTYLDFNAFRLNWFWKGKLKPIVVVRQVDDISRYGSIVINNEKAIISFDEKGMTGEGLINTGCYILPKNALDDFPPDIKFSIESDYFQEYFLKIQFLTYQEHGYFIDIGIPDDYKRAQIELPRILDV